MAAKRTTTRRKRGSGTIQFDKTTGQFIARTADRSRAARFDSRKAAEATLDEWNARAADGIDLRASRQTFQAFTSSWLQEVAANRVAPSTLAFYRRHLEYAVALIGQLAVEDIRPIHLQRMLNDLAATTLKPRSVAHVHSVVRNALKTAVDWGLIRENIAKRVHAPRVEPFASYALDDNELAALLDAVDGVRRLVGGEWRENVEPERLGALIVLAVTLGLRRSELLTLRWTDYDREARTLTVRTSKTSAGRRMLPLTSDLCARLDAHWQNQQEERRLPHWREHGIIFASEVGTPIGDRNITRSYKRILASAGLSKEIRLHDLRHTAISDWIAADADPKSAQALAGHASAQTTLNIYAKAKTGRQREVVEAAEKKRKKRMG